ncbi:MAG: hypothetical protein HOP28_10865 [Gemmatimonadales bacterium]|nr:hypothetical protein [Gemmatimonadales bacterium]
MTNFNPARVRHSAGPGLAWFALAGALLSGGGCRAGETLAPSDEKPPYLAVVAKLETGTLPDTGATFRYRVSDLSEGGVLDTVIVAAPNDTLILSVRPATYSIQLEQIPAKCVSRYGPTEVVLVPEGINTAIARFFISCNAPLAVDVVTSGGPDSLQFIWELTGPNRPQQTGIIGQKEEAVIFNQLAPGSYTFSLWNLGGCEPVSRGRRSQTIVVPPGGGARTSFTVVCSDLPTRPALRSFSWTYHDSTAVFIADVTDPDGNLTGYYFDLTDCAGTSVLAGGEKERFGLLGGRTARATSATIVGAFELGIDESVAAGRCASLRMVDDYGGTTPFIERLQGHPFGSAPEPIAHNALFIGTSALRSQLSVRDANDDYFGVFVAVRLRDGALGPPDGQPDLGIYNAVGYEGTELPDLLFGNRFQYFDVYEQILYLVDRKGNFRKVVDRDPFH